MKVSLWACSKRVGTEHDPTTCQGFRYVELGTDPGLCGHVTLRTSMGAHSEKTCKAPMDHVGDFEMEMT